MAYQNPFDSFNPTPAPAPRPTTACHHPFDSKGNPFGSKGNPFLPAPPIAEATPVAPATVAIGTHAAATGQQIQEIDLLVRALLALERDDGVRMDVLRKSWAQQAGDRDLAQVMNAITYRWYQAQWS